MIFYTCVAILILLILFAAECAISRWSAVFLWIDLHINFVFDSFSM